MSTTFNKNLKITTFNAKNDEFENINLVSDNLKAILIAIKILPTRADVYNIQNVNYNVATFLNNEFTRVKTITDANNLYGAPGAALDQNKTNVAVQLNNLPLDLENATFRNNLLLTNKFNDLSYTKDVDTISTEDLNVIYQYTNVAEYDFHHNGSILTMIKKELVDDEFEISYIPNIESMIFNFTFMSNKFSNINLNLYSFLLSTDNLRIKKNQVACVVNWLRSNQFNRYILLSGAIEDLDFDLDQLLYKGDNILSEYSQLLVSDSATNVHAPSNFISDPSHVEINILKTQLETNQVWTVPYSWILQYIRVVNYKQCSDVDLTYYKKPTIIDRRYPSINNSSKPVVILTKSKSYQQDSDNLNQDIICDPDTFSDSLTILKRELSLFNTLENVTDVNDRWSTYLNIFNNEVESYFPKGIFQAWAVGRIYDYPSTQTRTISNNSELLNLNHILVSSSLKPFVISSNYSTPHFSTDQIGNLLTKSPYVFDTDLTNTLSSLTNVDLSGSYVPDYSNVDLTSFFINRVYTTTLNISQNLPNNKIFETTGTFFAQETSPLNLDLAGINSLWNTLNTFNLVDISIFEFRKYQLDVHPLFNSFFYNSITNTFSEDVSTDETRTVFTPDTNIIFRTRKNDKITQQEFSDLLTEKYNQNNDHNTFIFHISYIEALVKAIKADSTISPIVVTTLYDYLSNGNANIDFDNVDLVNDLDALLQTLEEHLISNSRMMEVLIRFAVNRLEKGTWNDVPLRDLAPDTKASWVDIFYTNQDALDIWAVGHDEASIKNKLQTITIYHELVLSLISTDVNNDHLVDFLLNFETNLV